MYVCDMLFGINAFLTPFNCRTANLCHWCHILLHAHEESTAHTVSPVLSISVRNHAVHFVGQLILKPRNGPSGPACDEVRGGALHLVHAHVTGFGDLTLGEADKLGVPGKDAETLRDQDLKSRRRRNQPFSFPSGILFMMG